ncbi:UNVERIFIED_CONTAM: 2-carboxy-D-arabinitol-1-phosphatase [Sesamum calycinum]|uniref:2-carboxy-D-arabinitol-1-phosphatase n=1 Tax=Sesamum calycinum TaxID=2727403 RepID=A0AAW2KEF5_9LAMI
MLSTALTPHLFPLHKTAKFFRHRRRRPEVYPFRADVVRSSSSVQEIKKPSPVSSDERRELLTSWENIALPPVKAAKRVVLVRHGQSTWNAEGRIQGSSDFSVLTLKGESQAETSRQMLLDDSFEVCFSSPLIRSKRTAEIIWGSRTEEIITESNLREIDLYSFQGLLKNEGKAKYGAAYRQWQIDAPNFNIDVAHNAVNQALVATAMGLGTEYFRILLQSNCGVSVLDFTPKPEGGTPYICLNRLNQTPSSPVAAGSSGGRKACMRIILVSHGTSQNDGEQGGIPFSRDRPMNMLGVIQAQKTAELLLDVKVQEAADCLGADCVPRYVEMKQLADLDVESILKQTKDDSTSFQPLQSGWLRGYEEEITRPLWDQSGVAWKCLLDELSKGSEPQNVVVAVGHPALHIAMMGHCLNLTKEWLGSFHLDAGSITVVGTLVHSHHTTDP